MQSYLGVDVSKATLDVCLLLPTQKLRSKVFANDPQGFELLVQWLQTHAPGGPASVHVCMEATGSYHEALAIFLDERGVLLSVVNPLLVKRFAELSRQRNKTDRTDAKALLEAHRNEEIRPVPVKSVAQQTLPYHRSTSRSSPCHHPAAPQALLRGLSAAHGDLRLHHGPRGAAER